MSARFIAVYERPADPVAFERHYTRVHIPLALKLPGLVRYDIARNGTAIRGEAFHWIAELEWESMADLRAAFASPAGRATADDAAHLQRLATVRSMIFEATDAIHLAEE